MCPFPLTNSADPLPPHLAEHVALQMSMADDEDDDDDDDEDEKKDRFLEAAEEVISSMKQTGQIPSPSSSPAPGSVVEKIEDVHEEVKPLSDPSHKLSDHLIEPNGSESSDPSHTFEDHIADEIVAKANDPNLQTDTSDLILPDVEIDAIPGRVSWLKPKKARRKHIHKRNRNKEMPFSNGWKHTQEEHDAGSEEDKLFHQLEDMWAGDEDGGSIP